MYGVVFGRPDKREKNHKHDNQHRPHPKDNKEVIHHVIPELELDPVASPVDYVANPVYNSPAENITLPYGPDYGYWSAEGTVYPW